MTGDHASDVGLPAARPLRPSGVCWRKGSSNPKARGGTSGPPALRRNLFTSRSDVYSYDLAGNRTSHVRDGASTSYQQNAGGDRERNQYTLIGGLAQTYDLNGNQTSREIPAGVTEGRVFDESNRLVQLVRQNKTTSYRYDATGRRISKDLDDNGTTSRSVARAAPRATSSMAATPSAR